jgi:hypothetical protein
VFGSFVAFQISSKVELERALCTLEATMVGTRVVLPELVSIMQNFQSRQPDRSKPGVRKSCRHVLHIYAITAGVSGLADNEVRLKAASAPRSLETASKLLIGVLSIALAGVASSLLISIPGESAAMLSVRTRLVAPNVSSLTPASTKGKMTSNAPSSTIGDPGHVSGDEYTSRLLLSLLFLSVRNLLYCTLTCSR